MTVEKDLGARIKQVRTFKRISLEDLSQKANLSVESLEKIEDGEITPSLSLLILISRALGVRLGTFLDDDEQMGPVVTKADKQNKGVRLSKQGVIARKNLSFYPLATNKTGRYMDPFIIDIDPSVEENPLLSAHEGEEFIYVLRGRLEIKYGNDIFLLNEGDSIYFDSIVEHHLYTPDNEPAKILAVIHTPIEL